VRTVRELSFSRYVLVISLLGALMMMSRCHGSHSDESDDFVDSDESDDSDPTKLPTSILSCTMAKTISDEALVEMKQPIDCDR